MARYLQSAFAVLLIVFSASSSSATQRIEAESFDEDGQIEGCGLSLGIVPCPEASGGYGVDGVDCDGEWIKLHFSLASRTTFLTALRSAGAIGYVRTFRVDFLSGSPETPVADVSLVTVPGSGVT